MKAYVIVAEHPTVPGTAIRVCLSQETANTVAAEAVNSILKDCDASEKPDSATADSWEDAVEFLENYYGACNCTVYIQHTDVTP